MPEQLKSSDPELDFTNVLLRHTEDEIARYDRISHAQSRQEELITSHVEIDRIQHQAMTKDIAEVKRTVEQLAASMDTNSTRLTEALTRNTEELSQAVTGIHEILRDHEAKHQRTDKAFLLDEDGAVDHTGHKNFHFKSKDGARRRQKIIDGVLQGVALAATVSFIAFLGRILWLAVLQGPHQ